MKQIQIKQQITNRESQSLEKYFQEIGKVEMITAEEEVDLAKRIKEGDMEALEKLVKANLRFVVSVAKQYQNPYLTLGDLINEGNLGLLKAALKFDETRGFKFISYAVWWIRQSIMQALMEKSRVVRLPVNRVSLLNKSYRKSSELEQQFQREPTVEELAQALDVSPNEIVRNKRISGQKVSVDAPFANGQDGNLLDVLIDSETEQPDSGLLSQSLQREVVRALSILSKREAEILVYYYGLNGNPAMTLGSIATKLGITSERVRQLKKKATLTLRHCSSSEVLKDYL